MNPQPAHSSEPEIDRQAGEWFGRREGGLTPEQEGEFQQWLRADPRHAEHYAQFDETWSLLAELKDRVHGREAEVQMRASRATRIWLPATVFAAAAAAAILLMVPTPPVAGITTYTMATDAIGTKKLILPDGSVVRLNADTALTVNMSSSWRQVDLQRGEAHFVVARDPGRPFVVRAADITVRAIGTAFNVTLDSTRLEVLVTEGKVEVAEPGGRQSSAADATTASPVVAAGHKMILALEPASPTSPRTIMPVPEAEVARALAWQRKLLEFEERPLHDIVADFNRHNVHQLVIADAVLGRRTFSGNFRADDYEAFVELLESRFGVAAQRQSGQTILRTGSRR